MRNEVLAALVVVLVVVSAGTGYLVGVTTKRTAPETNLTTTPFVTTMTSSLSDSTCVYGCLGNVDESYQPCILGYSGFQVIRQYPNPSTWSFTLRVGSNGYLYYEYNVTKGLNYFVNNLNGPWTIWQTYQNGSNLLAEISGSTVIHVQYNVLNQFPVLRPNDSYTLGVQLSPENYTVRGNLVNITWSVKGLFQGIYPVEAPDLEWHTIGVAAPSSPVNTTSESFTGTCGSGGTVNS
jgi:hypothetical protein